MEEKGDQKVAGPKVTKELCASCAACPAACPNEALVMEGLELIIHEERCRPCGQAALVCPTGALKCPGSSARDENRRRR